MKTNSKQVLLCLMGGIIGGALPMTLTYCGVSREVIEFLFFWCVFLFVLLLFLVLGFGISRYMEK